MFEGRVSVERMILPAFPCPALLLPRQHGLKLPPPAFAIRMSFFEMSRSQCHDSASVSELTTLGSVVFQMVQATCWCQIPECLTM